MKILVVNAGSSSMKYQLIDMETETVIAKGLCERIGISGNISHKTADGRALSYDTPFPDHAAAFREMIKVLTEGEGKVINSMDEIAAVGHRGVHGGEKFASSLLITDEILDTVDELSSLAPLHNPPGLVAMKASQQVFGKDKPMVAVFDTAFHQTMPEKAYIYPIPYEYYEEYRFRRYGFHGTSHRFVSARLAEIKGRNDLKIVTCHLGNGSSIAAVDAGRSVDTSMGLTPLEGIIMGTRSGTIDPSLLRAMAQQKELSLDEVTTVLNKQSGLLGVSGVSNDQRDLHAAAAGGNKRAELAIDIQCYQIKKYIGSYAAAMGGLDAVIFTGGIGENDEVVRRKVCEDMQFFGIDFDAAKNDAGSRKESRITADGSRVEVWVIPTNEELLIARDTRDIVSKLK